MILKLLRTVIGTAIAAALMLMAGGCGGGASKAAAPELKPPSGSLDTSFGVGGMVNAAWGLNTCYARGIVQQSDGKILVAGTAYQGSYYDYDFAIARYNSNGILDSSFGFNGMVFADLNRSGDLLSAITIQPDEKILALGTTYVANYQAQFALTRHNPDGSLDTTFNLTGKVITPSPENNCEATSVTVQPDGKILVVGFSYANNLQKSSVVIRYNSNGMLDTSFNNTGILILRIGTDSIANSVFSQPNGKILVGGESSSVNSADKMATLIKLNSDGSLDTGFNGSGVVVGELGLSVNPNNAIVIQGEPRKREAERERKAM